MSSIGSLLRITTYGESHGKSVGCIVEGFPSGFAINIENVQKHLNRRRPGQSIISTSRNETDVIEVHSGLQNNTTLGTPISFQVKNLDIKPGDYSFRNVPRPGHADLTYKVKYGVNSDSGGGRASARETVGRVAAGGLCLEYLESQNIKITAWVQSVEHIINPEIKNYTREEVESLGFIQDEENIIKVRCPHPQTAKDIYDLINSVKKAGDSLGGSILCCISGLTDNFKEFMKTRAASVFGYSVMSIPSVKGFKLLNNLEDFCFSVGFKPVSTIKIPQNTCD